MRGVSGDDPEGGAGSGVLRRRLVTAGPGRPGTPPARHYDLAARSSLHGSGRQLPAVIGRRAPKETEARPEAQNRHGGAPRGERPAAWDARRLASAWRIASRYARRVPRTHPNVSRRSAHPSFGVSEAKLQTPDAENAPRERDGLFEIVRWAEMRCCPHPEERACAGASAKSNARA